MRLRVTFLYCMVFASFLFVVLPFEWCFYGDIYVLKYSLYVICVNIWNTVLSVCTTLDGRLVSGSEDKSIKVWDLLSGECQLTLKGHSGGGM